MFATVKLQPKNLAPQLLCTSKEYFILFCVHTCGIYIFFISPPSPFLPVAPLFPQSVLALFHFFLLQASIPPLAADPSPCPMPTMPIDLFVLRPYLSAISFAVVCLFWSVIKLHSNIGSKLVRHSHLRALSSSISINNHIRSPHFSNPNRAPLSFSYRLFSNASSSSSTGGFQ